MGIVNPYDNFIVVKQAINVNVLMKKVPFNNEEINIVRQFSDKVKILISKQDTLEEIGLGSRSSAKKVIKEIESLRNNLSHAQDIVTYDWYQWSCKAVSTLLL